jgi:hypothetical protein
MNEIYSLPDRRLKELSFGIANLKEGDRFGETLNKREAVLVLLSGSVSIKGEGYNHGKIEGCKSIAEENPVSIYCPPGLFASKAVSDSKIAIFRRWCEDKYKGEKPEVVSSETIKIQKTDQFTKRTIFVNDNAGSGFTVGEAVADEKIEVKGSQLFSNDPAAGGSEALMYFFSEDGEPCASYSISGSEGDEKGSINNNQTLIVPEGSSVDLGLEKSTCIIWIEGKK